MSTKLPHKFTEEDAVAALIEAHEFIGGNSIEARDIHAFHSSAITAVIYVAAAKLKRLGAIVEPEPEGHSLRIKRTHSSAGTRVSAFCEDLPMNGRTCCNGVPCEGLAADVCRS